MVNPLSVVIIHRTFKLKQTKKSNYAILIFLYLPSIFGIADTKNLKCQDNY